MIPALTGGAVSSYHGSWSIAPLVLSFSYGGKRENAPCTVEERKRPFTGDGGRIDSAMLKYACPYPRRGACGSLSLEKWTSGSFRWRCPGASPLASLFEGVSPVRTLGRREFPRPSTDRMEAFVENGLTRGAGPTGHRPSGTGGRRGLLLHYQGGASGKSRAVHSTSTHSRSHCAAC